MSRTGGTQARPWRPTSFAEWVKYAPGAFLACWDEGHRYEEWLGDHAQPDEFWPGALFLYQSCLRCTLPRDRWIGPQGEIDGRKNIYYYNRIRLPGYEGYPYLFHEKAGVFIPDMRTKRMAIRVERRRRQVEGMKVPKPPKVLPATADPQTNVVPVSFKSA